MHPLREHLTYPPRLLLASLELAAGRSPAELGLEGWTITDHSAVLGGEEVFAEASARLRDWRAHARAHVRASRTGDVVRLRFGPTRSSCLIVHEEHTPTRTVLVYGTLPRHVECGEEAFIVEKQADGTVTGRVVAFSRHVWWPARIAAPLARAVQRWATRAYVAGMRPPGFL